MMKQQSDRKDPNVNVAPAGDVTDDAIERADIIKIPVESLLHRPFREATQ